MPTNHNTLGSVLVITVVAAMLTVSAATILFFAFNYGLSRIPQQVVRFLLTAVICVFLYRGASVARWIAIVLSALAGAGSLLVAASVFITGKGRLLGALGMLAISAIYSSSFVVLAFVPSVKRHFSPQEDENGFLQSPSP